MNNSGHNNNKNVVLLITTLGSFLTPALSAALNVALPSIGREFSASAALLGWVASAYLLTAAMLLIPMGKVADTYGRKRVFLSGIGISVLASVLAMRAGSISVLICAQVLLAIGSAMIFSTCVAILISVFSPGERGEVLGINAAAVYAGLSVGPFVGGLLIKHFGWRSIYLANVPVYLLIIALIFWKMKGEWTEDSHGGFDFAGSVLLGLSMAAVMFGLSVVPELKAVGLIIAGLVGVVLFYRWELKVSNPILQMHLFQDNPVFTFSNLAALINYSATAGVVFLMSLYLQYIKGLDPESAGLVLIAQPVIMAVFSPIAGRISDKIEPGVIASVGMAVLTVGLVLLAFIGPETSLGFIVGVLALFGLGFSLFSSPNTNAVMGSVEKKYYGVASATLGTMRLTGQMLSIGLAMLIFNQRIGKVQITPELYPQFLLSMKTAFMVFAILCFAGIFASLARGKMHEGKT